MNFLALFFSLDLELSFLFYVISKYMMKSKNKFFLYQTKCNLEMIILLCTDRKMKEKLDEGGPFEEDKRKFNSAFSRFFHFGVHNFSSKKLSFFHSFTFSFSFHAHVIFLCSSTIVSFPPHSLFESTFFFLLSPSTFNFIFFLFIFNSHYIILVQ